MKKMYAASFAATCSHIFLMPFDVFKTNLQTEGKLGIQHLFQKASTYQKPFVFWYGSLGTVAAAFVSRFSWFSMYNFLDGNLKKPKDISRSRNVSKMND